MNAHLSTIESALKLVDRELWVVTAAAGPRRGGLLATWVSSASIDRERPVLLVGIAPNHFTAELIDASGHVGLHLLRPDQMATAVGFATGSGRDRDKLAAVELAAPESRAPLLKDCLAWFVGQVFARLATGDRTFYWIEVQTAGRNGDGPAARESDLFRAASVEQKAALLANRNADIAAQRPEHDAWRATLPTFLSVR